MWKRSPAGPIVFCVLAIALVAGLVRIMHIRLLGGEMYPEWSSLRSEPDGTRVLFESLAATGRYQTARSFRALSASRERNAAILLAGFSAAGLLQANEATLNEFAHASRAGNRVVLALDAGFWFGAAKQAAPGALSKVWGVGLTGTPRKDETVELYFDRAEGWTVLAGTPGKPRLIEKAFGAGTIVLAADAGPLSNQSLATARDSALLLQLVGPGTRVVFDEAHLGVQDTGSVMGLAHRYRLDGALWGLLALSIVFVWNRSVGFPPAARSERVAVAGQDARSGLAQLLRRQVPAGRVTEVCAAAWERSHTGKKLARPANLKDPVAAYRELQEREFSKGARKS